MIWYSIVASGLLGYLGEMGTCVEPDRFPLGWLGGEIIDD
jgi:hypothetical protein